jgi:23S rRNA pseudouridine2604 synthase
VIGQKIHQHDRVTVRGATKNKQYIIYYKPRGIITHSPAETEVDIASKIKQDYGLTDLPPIGRLDKDSEGLIVLSNDGRITGPLLNPESDFEKEYEVTVDKLVTGPFMKQLENGVNIEGYTTKKATAKKVAPQKFLLTITEGKKHQIRRMCAALGYQVKYLKRIRVIELTLGDLKPNQYKKIAGLQLQKFLATLGIEHTPAAVSKSKKRAK